jgi:ribosome-associated protein
MTAASHFVVNSRISIPRRELRFSFVRSAGPGGQNVNKVASKAVLRWDVRASPSLPEDVRERFAALFARRINDRGEVVVASQRYRDQAKNIDDCLDKLRSFILSAASKPKKRRKTRVPKAAREARLRQKRVTAEKKRRRAAPEGQ